MAVPKTIDQPGMITVTGRYITKRRQDVIEIFSLAVGVVGCCFFFGPIGVVVGFFAGWLLSYMIRWLFPTMLTFRFTADVVEVQGHAYSRTVPITFTNMATQTIGVAYGGGPAAMITSQDESKQLRMIYGTTEIVVAECRKPRHASQFAMACVSALSRSQAFATPPQPPVGAYHVTRIYDGPATSTEQRPALPPSGTMRRR